MRFLQRAYIRRMARRGKSKYVLWERRLRARDWGVKLKGEGRQCATRSTTTCVALPAPCCFPSLPPEIVAIILGHLGPAVSPCRSVCSEWAAVVREIDSKPALWFGSVRMPYPSHVWHGKLLADFQHVRRATQEERVDRELDILPFLDGEQYEEQEEALWRRSDRDGYNIELDWDSSDSLPPEFDLCQKENATAFFFSLRHFAETAAEKARFYANIRFAGSRWRVEMGISYFAKKSFGCTVHRFDEFSDDAVGDELGIEQPLPFSLPPGMDHTIRYRATYTAGAGPITAAILGNAQRRAINGGLASNSGGYATEYLPLAVANFAFGDPSSSCQHLTVKLEMEHVIYAMGQA